MSLGIVIKGPEGLVLAAESRVTIGAQMQDGQKVHANFDNATKLLSFSGENGHTGVVTYGLAAIGLRTAHSFMPEFEDRLPPKKRLAVQDFAKSLSDFFMEQWKAAMPPDFSGPGMTFVVGGFNEGESYGRVFLIEIPGSPDSVEQQRNPGEFGITWGGQREFVDRLIQGYDEGLLDIVSRTLEIGPEQVQSLKKSLEVLQMRIPLPAMPLQDCVDLAIFFIRTVVTAQRLTVGIRGCGGPIDVATITRWEGLRFVQRKEIVGEMGTALRAGERRPPWIS